MQCYYVSGDKKSWITGVPKQPAYWPVAIKAYKDRVS